MDLQKIKNVSPAIHAARFERTLLFRKIKQRYVLEGNVIQIEVAAKFQRALEKLAQITPEAAAARDCAWQPLEEFQHPKGRPLRIVNEIGPVPVVCGPRAGNNRRHTRRAVAEHAVETAP